VEEFLNFSNISIVLQILLLLILTKSTTIINLFFLYLNTCNFIWYFETVTEGAFLILLVKVLTEKY